MPNCLSVKKRLRQNKKRRLQNRYFYKSVKTLIKKIDLNLQKSREKIDKERICLQKNIITSKIDKLVKNKIIHKNKGANMKTKLNRIIVSILR
jgi:small subunit ribosomal protein S20